MEMAVTLILSISYINYRAFILGLDLLHLPIDLNIYFWHLSFCHYYDQFRQQYTHLLQITNYFLILSELISIAIAQERLINYRLTLKQRKISLKRMEKYYAKTTKAASGRIYKIYAAHAFSRGCNRHAFMAEITQGPCKGEKGVCKVFIDKKRRNQTDQIKIDISIQHIAKEYAVKFSQKLGDDHLLKVRESQIVRIEKVYQHSEFFGVGDKVAVERFIKPKFQRWTTCWGEQVIPSRTLNAFEHFVFVKSHGKRMICDLQGGKQGGHYILTDPTVSSTIDHGLPLNGGQKTIKKVMARHKCNQICHKLGL